MANKVLTVEINADTSKYEGGILRVVSATESIASATQKQINNLDRQIAAEFSISDRIKEKIKLAEEYTKSIDNILRSKLDEAAKAKSVNTLLAEGNRLLREKVSLMNEAKKFQFAETLGINQQTSRLSAAATSSQGTAYFGGAAQRVSQAVPKVDATTIKSAAPDLSYSLISGATKSAAIIKEAQKSFADRLAAVPIFKPSSDYAIQLTKGLSEAGRLANQTKQVVSEVASSQEKVKDKVNQTNTALDSTVTKHKSILVHVGEVILSYRTLNSIINVIQQALLNIPRAGIQLESATAALTATFKSQAGAAQELQFLREEADRTGISIQTLRESYSKAAASFVAAGESASRTREIFANINTVATTLHLSTDQTSSVYLALSQIFNKTKLQAEELTKQLAQTIPGVTNEQAKALGITVSELYDKMKKGAISANQAVFALSQTLAETYGGEAFAKASQGLNSELGRVNSAWTLLSENIYKGSSDMMISVLKFTTGSIEGFERLTSDTYKVRTGIQDLIASFAGLVAGFVTAKAAIIAYTKYTELAKLETFGLNTALQTVGATIKQNIFTAAIVEIGILSAKFATFRGQLADLDAEASAYQQQQAAKTPEEKKKFAVSSDPEVKRLASEVEVARKRYERYSQGFFTASIEDQQKAYSTYNTLSSKLVAQQQKVTKELEKTAEATKGSFVVAAKDRSEEIAKVEADFIAATESKIEGAAAKTKYRYRKIIDGFNEDLKSQDPKIVSQAKEQLERINTIIAAAGEKAGASSGASAKNKALREEYKTSFEEIKNGALQSRDAIVAALQDIDEKYQENTISIKDYFAQKKQLQDTDLSVQLEMVRQEKEVAVAKGDKLQASKLDNDYIKLQIAAKNQDIKLTKEQIAAEREYYALKIQNHAQFLELQGKGGESALAQFDVSNRNLKEKLTVEGDKQALKEFNTIRANVGLKATLADLDNKRSLAEQQYQNDIDRTNILVNIGAKSSLSAARDIEEANKKIIALKEEQLAKMDEEIAKTKELGGEVDVNVTAQNEKLRNEIEKLKLTADTTAQYFSRVMGDAFENSFAAFVTGSQTASQAFSSFANSVVSSIAKIIAEELKSNIMSLLFQAGSSIMGSFGGSGVSVAAGNSAGFTSSMNNLFSGFKLANGGATTGLSSASSTVLTQPTLFPGAKVIPFASGGVLAGEAGAEAVLPLKRGRNGKLGVAMEDGQQSSGGNIININVSVARSQGEDDSAYTAKIAEAIARRIAKEEVANGARTGNINNRITKFG